MKRAKRSLDEYNEIKQQVSALVQNKKSLNGVLEKIKGDFAVNQDDELELINDLEGKAKEMNRTLTTVKQLIKAGVDLHQRISQLEKELAGVQKRLDALTKIHSELEGLWKE